MLTLINRVATLIIFLAGTTTLVMAGMLVATQGGVDIIGLQARNALTPAPISIGPTPIASTSGQPVAPQIRGAAPLNSVIAKRPLFQTIPLPQEISRRPEVVGTNIVLSILLALALGLTSMVLNNVIRNHEAVFATALDKTGLAGVARAINRGSHLAVRRGCLGLPIIMLIFAFYGIIFAFLEKGINVFNPDGVQLALVMAMSVGLVSLGGDMAQRLVSRFWHSDTRYGLYPANLLIAVVTTFLSRTLNLTPGIVFGVPGGADVELQGERRRLREVVLAFTTLATVIVLGALGWGLTGALANAGTMTVTAQTLEFAGPLVRLAQTLGLAVFAIAIQTAFFEMWPLTNTLGSRLFKWNGIVWAITFVPIVFIFAHTMLNPNSDFLSAFKSSNVQTLTIVLMILMLVTFALWAYFAVTDRGRTAAPAIGGMSPYDASLGTTMQGLHIPRPDDAMKVTQTALKRPDFAQTTVSTREIPIPRQAAPAVHDTQPLKPITIEEPSVSPHDTQPRIDPPKPPKKPIRQSRYPDPSDPYSGLFPPAQPGDDDYLESLAEEGSTPPSGMHSVSPMPVPVEVHDFNADDNNAAQIEITEVPPQPDVQDNVPLESPAASEPDESQDQPDSHADHPASDPPDSLPL